MFLHANSEDSDQTERMRRLIRVFAGRTGHFVGYGMWWQCINVFNMAGTFVQQLQTTSFTESLQIITLYVYYNIEQ